MKNVRYEYDVVLTKTGDTLASYQTREEERIEKREWNQLLYNKSNTAKILQRKYVLQEQREVR